MVPPLPAMDAPSERKTTFARDFPLNSHGQYSEIQEGRENEDQQSPSDQRGGPLFKCGQTKGWGQEDSTEGFELSELIGSLETTASTVGRGTSDLALELLEDEPPAASQQLSSAMQDLAIETQQPEFSEVPPRESRRNQAERQPSSDLNGQADSRRDGQPRTITIPLARQTVSPVGLQDRIAASPGQTAEDVAILHSAPQVLPSASVTMTNSRFSAQIGHEEGDSAARSAPRTRTTGLRLGAATSPCRGEANTVTREEKLKNGGISCPLAPRMQSQAPLFCIPDLTDSEMLPEAASMVPFPRRVHSLELPGQLAHGSDIPCLLSRGMSDQLEQALEKVLRGERSQRPGND